jgi:hypothetical protein
MKCEKHPANEVDGKCEECGRDICCDCRAKGEPICQECLENAPLEGEEEKSAEPLKCHECGAPLRDDEKQLLGDNWYCKACVEKAKQNITKALDDMTKDIAWPKAVVFGAVVAAVGALLWMVLEVYLNIRLGIIAVAIGYGAGYAVVIGSGGKRGIGLQILSAALTFLGIAGGLFLGLHADVAKAIASGEVNIPKGAEWEATVTLFPLVMTKMSIISWVIIAFGLWQAFVIPAMPKINLGSAQEAA